VHGHEKSSYTCSASKPASSARAAAQRADANRPVTGGPTPQRCARGAPRRVAQTSFARHAAATREGAGSKACRPRPHPLRRKRRVDEVGLSLRPSPGVHARRAPAQLDPEPCLGPPSPSPPNTWDRGHVSMSGRARIISAPQLAVVYHAADLTLAMPREWRLHPIGGLLHRRPTIPGVQHVAAQFNRERRRARR